MASTTAENMQPSVSYNDNDINTEDIGIEPVSATSEDNELIGDDPMNTASEQKRRLTREERIAAASVHNLQKKKNGNGIKYRALVGIKSAHIDGPKKVRDEYHVNLMSDLLKHWDSTVPVRPYFDKSIDPDKQYRKLIQHTEVLTELKKNHDIDNPLDVLNFYGNPIGHIYYKQIPSDDRKNRNRMRTQYERLKNQYAQRGEEIPEELAEEYEYAVQEPTPGAMTGIYAYSCINPNGMFSAYEYPIQDSYNGISTATSRLVNRNYGTYHDIIQLRDLDFEATMLPEVVFRPDGRMFESDDPQEIENFLYETMNGDDYIALIECYL